MKLKVWLGDEAKAALNVLKLADSDQFNTKINTMTYFIYRFIELIKTFLSHKMIVLLSMRNF